MCLVLMFHWLLTCSFIFSCFFFLSHLFNFLFVIVSRVSERRLVLNCCSDLTPTQASKSREALVGIWTTGGRIQTQTFSHFLSITFCFLSHLVYDYPFFHQVFFNASFLFSLCSPFALSQMLHLICLSVSLFLPSPSPS